MTTADKPLTYGIRQAIRDSPKTTYEIGKQCQVLPQNLYRFLDEEQPRGLSQKSIDSLGLLLKLSLVKTIRGRLTFHTPIQDRDRKPLPNDTPLTDYLRHAFESSRKLVPEIANAIDISPTQFYRFLDKTRGLSQDKLDGLCGLLGLVVEGPPDAAARAANARTMRRGSVFLIGNKTYIPPPRTNSRSTTGTEDEFGPPPRPRSLPSSPGDEAHGDS